MRAFVYRSGEIELGQRPIASREVLEIAQAPAKILREAVSSCARLAYDGTTWLCPGLPEADDEEAALDAVTAFQARLHRAIRRLSEQARHPAAAAA